MHLPIFTGVFFNFHTIVRGLYQYLMKRKSQIRKQMSGPEISCYGKSILGYGLWPGQNCGKKRVCADYEQLLRPVFFTLGAIFILRKGKRVGGWYS